MGTIKLYKKYRKLNDGGLPPNQQFAQGVGYGNSALQIANVGNQMFGDQGNEFGVKDDTSAISSGVLSGAATGASMGSAFGPYGVAIGAGVGGIYGGIKANQTNKEAQQREQEYKKQQSQLFLQNQHNQFNQAINSGFNPQGNMSAQRYAKNGGLLSTIYKNGGSVQKLSKTNVQFNGKSHENGGIKEPLVNGVKLNEVEVEDKESMSTSNGQKFVFSENLGFAQQHKPLARAMGKIEKKLSANPNDPISKRTLNTLKEREELLKVKQEETKEALGLENNLGEMKMGGAIKRKDGTYIDREGVMKYPLKNGGMIKYANGGVPPYENKPDLGNTLFSQNKEMTVPYRSLVKPYGYENEVNFSDPLVKGVEKENLDTTMMLPDSNQSKMNWGNLASKVVPYVGAASNYALNEQARKMTTPKEALPDYVKYKPVDYSASRIEADQQRRQLNKSLTQNVTNSAVAAALKAKNLGTTIGAKNMINQEEMNINTQGINQNNLVNNQIQSRRNQIDVENRDRDYNKEQRYLTQKGEIVNNFSDIYQQQSRDRRLYDLEDRKIDVLKDVDTGRGVYGRNFEDDTKKQKESYKKGGIVKKTNKLYNKLKK